MKQFRTDGFPTKAIYGMSRAFTIEHGLMASADGFDDVPDLKAGERRLLRWRIPTWQRPLVWNEAQKVRLIESLWLGLPIATYIYNTVSIEHPLDMVLVDGQQRWTALKEYAEDKFPVFGKLWSQVNHIDQRHFKMIGFPSIEIHIEDEAALKDIYERLAYGGTPHIAANPG